MFVDTAQLSEYMDWQRLERAILIPIEHVSLKYCCILPLRIVATIQGNQCSPYKIIIDQNHGIYHDCPDFQRPNTFCKHLGRLTSLFPSSIQQEILSLFTRIGKNSRAEIQNLPYVTPIFSQQEEIPNLDFFSQIQSIFPLYQEESLLSTHFEKILCDWVYFDSHSALSFMNSYPQLIPRFQKMLENLRRPIPNYLDTCISDPRYSPEMQNLIWNLLTEVSVKDAIELHNGLQIIL
jgi:hypothetical protein